MNGLKPFWASNDDDAEWLNKPIFGAEEGEEGGDPGDDPDGDAGDDPDGDSGDTAGDGGNEPDPKEQRIAELSTEAKNRRLALRAKEKEVQELQAQLEAAKNKDKDGEVDEDTRQKIEGPLKDQYEKLLASSRSTAIKNAILAEAQKEGEACRVWHSADNVISQMNMDSIDYDPESGTIEGVSDELDRIAEDQPFLIKSKGKPKRQVEKKDEEQKGKRGASGNQPGGAGRQVHGMDAKRKKELGQKFPILNRR